VPSFFSVFYSSQCIQHDTVLYNVVSGQLMLKPFKTSRGQQRVLLVAVAVTRVYQYHTPVFCFGKV